jgi:prepilin-type processing-associated H-X9-DG protein
MVFTCHLIFASEEYQRYVMKNNKLVLSVFISLCAMILVVVYVKSCNSDKENRLCMDNMRIISQQIKMYMQDNDDMFPNVYTWQRKIPLRGPYKESIYCPISGVYEKKMNGVPGYALNGVVSVERIDPVLDQVPHKGSDVIYPMTTVLVCEQALGVPAASAPNPWLYSPQAVHNKEDEHACERHSGGSHYLFCDGHVQWLKPEEVNPQGKGNDGKKPSFAIGPKG